MKVHTNLVFVLVFIHAKAAHYPLVVAQHFRNARAGQSIQDEHESMSMIEDMFPKNLHHKCGCACVRVSRSVVHTCVHTCMCL